MLAHVIHLPSATEREPLITALGEALGWSLKVTDAADGSNWSQNPTIPKTHPWTHQPVSKGVLGCAESHLRLIQEAWDRREEELLLFEDDCEALVRGEDLEAFLKHVRASAHKGADIILFGANEYVDFLPIDRNMTRVKRFWGTHAMLLNRTAMAAVARTFGETQREGFFYPADWLYNEAILRHKLSCIGPSLPQQFVRQKPGLISAITGQARRG